MEKISQQLLPTPDQCRFYDPETPDGKLETAILVAGKAGGIGNLSRNPAYMKLGVPERAPGLDLTIESRAYRTLDIRKFSRDEIERIHNHEKSLGLFITFLEMKRVTSRLKVPNQFHLKPDQLDDVRKFNNSHRPLAARMFHGMRIPPYFVYDLEFDGMEYHHAWDLSVKAPMWAEPVEIHSGKARATREVLI